VGEWNAARGVSRCGHGGSVLVRQNEFWRVSPSAVFGSRVVVVNGTSGPQHRPAGTAEVTAASLVAVIAATSAEQPQAVDRGRSAARSTPP